jgi:hypothetical protein
MGESKDWNKEAFIFRVKSRHGTFFPIDTGEAKKICEFFLSFYYDWLLRNEPRATSSRSEINDILGLLQGDLNEVLRTE